MGPGSGAGESTASVVLDEARTSTLNVHNSCTAMRVNKLRPIISRASDRNMESGPADGSPMATVRAIEYANCDIKTIMSLPLHSVLSWRSIMTRDLMEVNAATRRVASRNIALDLQLGMAPKGSSKGNMTPEERKQPVDGAIATRREWWKFVFQAKLVPAVAALH